MKKLLTLLTGALILSFASLAVSCKSDVKTETLLEYVCPECNKTYDTAEKAKECCGAQQVEVEKYVCTTCKTHHAKVEEDAYSDGYTYSDGSSITRNILTPRYFKVEPIKWQVLTANYNNSNTALLFSEKALDSDIYYYALLNNREINSSTVYLNNYKYSTIRAYLNGSYESDDVKEHKRTYENKGFLQAAFTASAQNLIAVTEVDNSASSTADTGGTIAEQTDYACENTNDKIFLLSQKEVTTEDYGFIKSTNVPNSDIVQGKINARVRFTTDYAKAKGAYDANTKIRGCSYWLRSPAKEKDGYSVGSHSALVGIAGTTQDVKLVNWYHYGVVPAMCITLE